ncbi:MULTISPECIES: 2-amino-4-hydroxy-6-hydroxymethyldihydropteridine diphosphokinase [Deefgea]|uniref:2-amino-4-hydroxy-6-hydroxymethyldihydropteridine pyrophosphokinase n=1 Tax=Deefgea chitinilytica TaxID=570276 RepID=A0ABS2CB66_9NEIS|nr:MULTISPECIES: 2-amino-4-hydroxy-6-hydroxymethyldihydropteridine diphosphokinase [Deefgea]MBM5571394.1 2-amino-4-hydroxy-6-hydroxymethyldihydropteridine diphosphokinase [Deefgea chitinilytica]MBM9888627.1 2-amino-4-hydroxy-6-hydroxymethyldihydropteridine diphosphokinase [Deefgea sp. CFH1-16]
MTRIYVALGANLGDPVAQLQAALRHLAAWPTMTLLQTSSFYASAPVGYTDQPDFVNAVCELETELSAVDVLAALLAIEAENGRERNFKNSPRTLDLDLILYGNEQIDLADLTVPHPRMHQRAFVLQPLLEIAPQAQIPGLGAAQDYLAAVAAQTLTRIPEKSLTSA